MSDQNQFNVPGTGVVPQTPMSQPVAGNVQDTASVEIPINQGVPAEQEVASFDPTTPVVELDKPEVDTSLFEPLDPQAKKDIEEEGHVLDFDAVLREHTSAVNSGEREIKNLEKMPIGVPMSSMEDLEKYKFSEVVKNQDNLTAVLSDMTSTVQSIANSQEFLTENQKLLTEALKKIAGDLNKVFARSVKGVGDSEAVVFKKYQGQSVVELKGSDGLMAMTALTGGMRRVTLWNSGITLTLRNIPLDILNLFYRELNHNDFEYGKQYGAFYYLFADLSIAEYIIEHLLPLVICGSNYIHWKEMDKLRQVIQQQDFHVILWAMGLMMHPTGAHVNFVCAEENCGHIHTEFVDLAKLRLINTDLINDYVIEHFKRPGFLDDSQLEEYRKHLNLTRSVEFEYGERGLLKKWKVNLRQSSLFDFATVGKDYNTELRKHCSPRDIEEVHSYTTYNQYRCYKPWIDSVELTIEHDGTSTTFIMKNNGTEENDKSIYMLLDEFQQNVPEFSDMVKSYILETKISHICFYFPACPKCGKEPRNGYHGYIPYDPMQAFFTLALMKLLQGASTRDTRNTSKSTARS